MRYRAIRRPERGDAPPHPAREGCDETSRRADGSRARPVRERRSGLDGRLLLGDDGSLGHLGGGLGDGLDGRLLLGDDRRLGDRLPPPPPRGGGGRPPPAPPPPRGTPPPPRGAAPR